MPDQQPAADDLAAKDEDVQRLVLSLVADQDQHPWSVEEIARTLESKCSRLAIEDAISELRKYGLLNQAERIVFASQAAAHLHHLGMLEL